VTRSEPRVFAAGELETILAEFGMVVGAEPTPPPAAENGTPWLPAGLSDTDVQDVLFGFDNGEEYRQLYSGELGYGDASSGDWRLIMAIAWIVGPDADQVERIVRASGRVRPKWDERRGAATLLRWEIDKAIHQHRQGEGFYDGRGANALPWFSAGDWMDEDEDVPTRSSSPAPTPAPGCTVDADDNALPAIPDYPIDCLPDPMRELVEAGVKRGLDAALVAGAALAAAATAIGNQVDIMSMLGWLERPIVWIPLIAPPGAGKSPAQELALGPLRVLNEALLLDYADQLEAWHSTPQNTRPATPPKDPSMLTDDVTLEALARIMDGNGALGADLDELSGFLLGLGQYKLSASSDRARLLRLWTGSPWRYTRVGSGSKGTNAINILIPKPVLVIVGSLPTEQHHLLGDDRDGLRPRFLPHLADVRERETFDLADVSVDAWGKALDELVSLRGTRRVWRLDAEAKLTFQAARRHWKHQVHGNETPSTAAALEKADVHALRVCLIFAELWLPGQVCEIAKDVVESAIAVVDYTLDCWRALGSAEYLSLSRRDEALNAAIPRLVAWLERRGPVNSNLIQHNHVGGVHTADELKALLTRYAQIYPGTLQSVATGGRPAVTVSPPIRRSPA
jgi:hypothetical protein